MTSAIPKQHREPDDLIREVFVLNADREKQIDFMGEPRYLLQSMLDR